ncbi:MAG: hypothetical protein LDL41_07500 [Coleofasciculus sp. S288]|nr:hypothetical protein [Coleofasciculus sp. S288]
MPKKKNGDRQGSDRKKISHQGRFQHTSEPRRLMLQGRNICTALKSKGYSTRKQRRELAYSIRGVAASYLLIYIPNPVAAWTLLPRDKSPIRLEILTIIQGALK